MTRPRLRGFDGKEQALPSREAAQSEDWLGKWAMNQLLINVSTRKDQRSMRLPRQRRAGAEGGRPVEIGDLPAFCRPVGGAAKEWMASDLSGLDLPVIQMDGAFTWTRTWPSCKQDW